MKTEDISSLAAACCVAPRLHEEVVRIPNGVLSAWGYKDHLWPQNSVIRVRFLSGDPEQQRLLGERFAIVDSLINLSFKRVTSGPSECRVRFDQNSGHWSYVGLDNRHIAQNQQTMNIALNARSSMSEWDRVGIHEILHLVGLNHEHQHPHSSIPWNKPVVYQVYGSTQGWSRREIDFQVLNPSSPTGAVGTTVPDLKSIMMYPIERKLLLPGKANDKFVVGWNAKLSDTDLSVLHQFYPTDVRIIA